MSATATHLEGSPTPILDRLQPMPEGKTTPHSRKYGLIAGLLAVCLPVAFISLMIWSPSFLAVAEPVLGSIEKSLDAIIHSVFAGQWGGLVIAALLPLSLFGVVVI